MMRKRFFAGLCSFITSLFCAGFASALDIRRVSESMINGYVQFFEPVLRALFGGESWTGELLFEKLLFFIVFLCLVYLALKRVPLLEEKKGIVWIISIAVALLGTRFVNTASLLAVIMQYKVLAIVLTAILPFVIYFFFLAGVFPGEADAFMRKLGWLLFIVVYVGLWTSVPDDVQAEIFFWSMVAAIVFALFGDKYVEKYLREREFRRGRESVYYEEIAKIDERIRLIRDSTLPEHIKKAEIKKLDNARKNVLAGMH